MKTCMFKPSRELTSDAEKATRHMQIKVCVLEPSEDVNDICYSRPSSALASCVLILGVTEGDREALESSALILGVTTADGEPSAPISALRSLMLCSNSSIRHPISSIFVMMDSDITWNLDCICCSKFCTNTVMSAVVCLVSTASRPSMVQLISVSDEILSLLTSKANFEIKTRNACLRVTSKV
uniref:Uncharacterized protein n=2 Tax=Opuntia streptacantha TaxID=393608 RepID=A0A7C9E3U4_OPUST